MRGGLGGFTPVMVAWLLVLAVLAASCAPSQQGEIDASPPTQDAPQPPRSDPPSGEEHATQTDAEQVALAGTDTQGRVFGPVTVDAGGTVEFEGVRVVVPPGAVSTDGLLRVGAAEQIELGDWMDWAVPPVEVSLEGAELTGRAILEVSLDAVEAEPAELVGVHVAHDGLLEAFATEVSGGVARFETPHFSPLGLGRVRPDEVVGFLVDGFTAFVSGRAGVDQPACDGEALARERVEPWSDSGDLVKWCLGHEDGRLVLRVANNRSAAVTFTYPKTWDVQAPRDQSVTISRLGTLLSEAAPTPPGWKVAVVPAGATATLYPAHDAPEGVVRAEMDLLAWTVSGFDVAFDVWLSILGRFAGSQVNDSQVADSLAGLTTVSCLLGVIGDHLGVGDGSPPPENAFTEASTIGIRCGYDSLVEYLRERGLGVAGRTAVAVVGGLVSFVVSGAQVAIAGGRLLYDGFVGADTYDIRLVAVPTEAVDARLIGEVFVHVVSFDLDERAVIVDAKVWLDGREVLEYWIAEGNPGDSIYCEGADGWDYYDGSQDLDDCGPTGKGFEIIDVEPGPTPLAIDDNTVFVLMDRNGALLPPATAQQAAEEINREARLLSDLGGEYGNFYELEVDESGTIRSMTARFVS